MNKKHEILPVILGVITACALLAAATLIFMDTLMRTFAPGIYVGGRLLNTYNELEKEYSEKDSLFSGKILPSDNTDITFTGSLDDLKADFSGQYDKEHSAMYFTGTAVTPIGAYDAQLFSENGETGICLPDYADVWLCAPNGTFMKKLENIGIFEAAGVTIPNAEIFLQNSENSSDYLKKLYPIVKNLLQDIKTDGYSKKDSGIAEYRIYVKGQALKKVMSDATVIMLENGNWANRLKAVFENGEFMSSAAQSAREYIDGLTFPETVAFSVYERKKCIVCASTSFTVSDANIRLWIDMSEKARLYDSIDGGIQYNLDGSAYGFSYRSAGNHFYRKEKLADNTKIEITLPLIEKTVIEKEIKFTDTSNFKYSLKAVNDRLFHTESAGSGTHTSSELTLGTENSVLTLGDKEYSIQGSITFKPSSSVINIPSKEKYSIDSLSLADFIKIALKGKH